MKVPIMFLWKSLNRGLTRNLLRINHLNICSVRHHNFDGETYSKSNVNLITKEDDGHIYVEAFSSVGFRLSSGLRILGPCALFPKSVLHWNVASSQKITPDSLALFCMLEPKPDILVIGIGSVGAVYDKNIIKYLRSKGINVEILPSEQACSTFNFLNAERRVVAAALIPPKEIEYGDDNIMISDMKDKENMDNDIEAIDTPFTSKITETMTQFRDKGMLKTISEMDREREKRDLEKRKDDSDEKGAR